MTNDIPTTQKEWTKLPTQGLYRYEPSGTYFARLRVRGKLFRRSLDTTVLTTAKLRLADYRLELDKGGDAVSAGAIDTVANLIEIFQERQRSRVDIKESSKAFRDWTIQTLKNNWPGLEDLNPKAITPDACRKFGANISGYSVNHFNNVTGTLKMILAIAVETGAIKQNPADVIAKKPKVKSTLILPTAEQFTAFLKTIDESGEAWCHKCSDMIRFLVYSGLRKSEAAAVVWGDIDLPRGQLVIRDGTTKNGDSRVIPIIADMRTLLESMRSRREPAELGSEAPVLEIGHCQETMNRAALAVGMVRITHHDLRHIFATKALESGIDMFTLSRWLGHKDGGILVGQLYGHLRQEHSQAMAAKMKF